MRYEELFLAGIGAYLPPTVDVEDAVASGRYDAEEQHGSGQQAVTVATPADTAPEMACRAGRIALDRSGHRASDVSLLLHAVTGHNGLDGWNAASYLQHHVLDGAGVAYELRQQSNGAMGAVALAAAWLATAEQPAALITASDRFDDPAWDRWRSNYGLVFADGAGAAVLSRRTGFARILSAVTVADPGLEVLHRGSLPFGPVDDAAVHPIDFRARMLDSSRVIDLAQAGVRLAAGMRAAVVGAATEAGIDVVDAEHYVVPNFGRELLHRECLDVLGIDLDRTTWRWGSSVGHLGAADQFAALAHLSEAGRLAAGDRVLMIGVGGGFNWTCLVVEVLHEPAWV